MFALQIMDALPPTASSEHVSSQLLLEAPRTHVIGGAIGAALGELAGVVPGDTIGVALGELAGDAVELPVGDAVGLGPRHGQRRR